MKHTFLIFLNILLSICAFPQVDSIKNIKESNQIIFVDGYQSMPEYPGGDEPRIKYCQTLAIYTNQAIKDGIEGLVFTNFNIEKDGTITNPKILRGIHHDLDSISIWMIKRMPKWSPAILEGKPVSVSYTLPIRFKLNGRSLNNIQEPSDYWSSIGKHSFYNECFNKRHKTEYDCNCWYAFIVRNYNELKINSIDLDLMFQNLKCN